MSTEYPNKEAFEKVCKDLESGEELTFAHVGAIFGDTFWIMIVECLLDSQDAARAIQGAIARLAGSAQKVVKES